MSCQYKYKSGIRYNQVCGSKLESKTDKYCKLHKRIIKAQETRKRKKMDKSKVPKPKKSLSSSPPSKKRKINTGVGTNSDNDDTLQNIHNLFSLFELPILPLKRQKAIANIESKIQEESNTPPPLEIKFDVNSENLNNIKGLLKVIKYYKNRPITMENTINYDLEKLCNIEDDLIELNNMIGLKKIKARLCDMFIYLCQKRNQQKTTNKTSDLHNEYLHTVLQGPPGCGKSSICRILSNIYKKLGFLSKGNIVYAKRSDLVGKYCGHTAYLTQNKINEAKGGVLFIDEAYTLGNKDDNPDAFSRECIDTLNQNLSERNDFICIIAGYKKELDKRFFSVNPGLSRRFPWVFNIEEYTSRELHKMFESKANEMGFEIEEGALPENFFGKNKENFPYYGGSIHTFLNKIKICNYKKMFGMLEKENKITKNDIKNAFEMYKLLEMGNKKAESNKPPMGMYL